MLDLQIYLFHNTTLVQKLSACCVIVFVVVSFTVVILKCIQYHVAVADVTFVLTEITL